MVYFCLPTRIDTSFFNTCCKICFISHKMPCISLHYLFCSNNMFYINSTQKFKCPAPPVKGGMHHVACFSGMRNAYKLWKNHWKNLYMDGWLILQWIYDTCMNETCPCCWVWQCGWHACISDLLATLADTCVEQYKWQYQPHYSAEFRWRTRYWISPGPEGHQKTLAAGLHQGKLLLSSISKATHQDLEENYNDKLSNGGILLRDNVRPHVAHRVLDHLNAM